MINGIYNNSTKIFFGKGAEDNLPKEILKYSKNILLVYGKDSCKKIGLYDKIINLLQSNDIIFKELSGIRSNPTSDKVNEGIEICEDYGINFILAVGGGSVIDTAKMIVLNNGNIKLGTILTIPGSGSECNPHAVMTDVVKNEKVSYTNEYMRPVFSVLNPEYTMSLSYEQTAIGILDSMIHVLERYYSNTDNVKCSDGLCLSVLGSLLYYYSKIEDDLTNYDYRAEIMWLCSLANGDTIGFGRKADWSSHAIAHELNAYYPDVPHGNLVYIIFSSWLKFVKDKNDKYNKLEIFNKKFNFELELYLQHLDIHINLKSIDVDMPKIFSEVANKCCGRTQSGTIGNFVRLTNNDIEIILQGAYQ